MADQEILDWAKATLKTAGEAEMEMSIRYGDGVEKPGLSIILLSVRPLAGLQGKTPSPYQVELKYLVSVRQEQPRDSHRILGILLAEAMMQTESGAAPFRDVLSEEISLQQWMAIGARQSPGFVVRAVKQWPRKVAPRPAPPKVLDARVEPLDQDAPHNGKETVALGFHGMVLDAQKVPIAMAKVTLPTLGLVTQTDIKGRFGFAPVAGQPSEVKLTISLNGRQQTVTALQGKPTIVRW